MPQIAIQVENLDKRFDDIHAVDNISFNVQQGEIFSLLGPNGAGKSTTISMISGLLSPDEGDASILGHSITQHGADAKACIGIVPQEIALYEDLTARENMEFWGKMYGLRGQELRQRVDEVLQMIGLTERQKDRIEKYSGGMKRRVNIGVALLHKPAVIIMDEPTVGIDPQSRRHILDGVKELQAEGATILYTTHYMEEAQELSDHIAIMDNGQIMASGTHDELVRLIGRQDQIDLQLSAPSEQVIAQWQEIPGVAQVAVENGLVTILADDSNVILPRLFDVANENEVRITAVDIQEPNLESVFLHLTGRALRD
ncbi:MAG: ATP-binding cassette domain-containing protein [Chloroflexi bacterium]|nr:ATP-binding cassette domain-containing protein [Chloroflexota bacterium]